MYLTKQNHQTQPFPPDAWTLDELQAELSAQRAKAALSLLEAVFADPTQAIPLARAAGVNADMFSDDLRTLFGVAATVADFSSPVLLKTLRRFARLALEQDGWWDDSPLPANPNYGAALWSESSLTKLLERRIRHLIYPAMISERSRRLVEICRREREARAHFDECRKLLEGVAA